MGFDPKVINLVNIYFQKIVNTMMNSLVESSEKLCNRESFDIKSEDVKMMEQKRVIVRSLEKIGNDSLLRRLDQINNEVKESELLLEKTDRLLEKLEAGADYKTIEQLPIISEESDSEHSCVRTEQEHHDLPTDHGHPLPVCEQGQGHILSDHAHSLLLPVDEDEDDIAKMESNLCIGSGSKKEKQGDVNDDDALECPDVESEQVLEEGKMVYALSLIHI